MKWLFLFGCIVVALMTTGCGGSGRNPLPTANPRVDVTWPEVSRSVTAPTSALSVRVSIRHSVNGTPEEVLTQVFDRPSGSALNISTYTLRSAIPVGTYTFDFDFFSQAGAAGSLVGKGATTAEVALDGGVAITLSVPTKVASVTVLPGQIVSLGSPAALLTETRDGDGAVLAIDPQVIRWVSADTGKLRFENGAAVGVGVTAAVAVTAAVDGVASTEQSVQVRDDQLRAEFIAAPVGFHGLSMSGDGRYVGGYLDVPGSGRHVARWTVGSPDALIVQPLDPSAGAIEVSAAGTFSIGGRPTSLWSVPGGVQIEIGYPQATQTNAQSIDDGGNTVVGAFTGTSLSGAFRWKASAGIQRIFGEGEAANLAFAHVRTARDGNTVAAITSGDQNLLAVDRAGVVTLYDTSPLQHYFAVGVGDDAPIVVTKQSPMEALIVTRAGISSLSKPDGYVETIAHAVSGDGSVIVGEAYTASANSKAFLWLNRAPVSLSEYVATLGLSLNQFHRFYLVSLDGKSMYGTNGDSEGVVRISSP